MLLKIISSNSSEEKVVDLETDKKDFSRVRELVMHNSLPKSFLRLLFKLPFCGCPRVRSKVNYHLPPSHTVMYKYNFILHGRPSHLHHMIDPTHLHHMIDPTHFHHMTDPTHFPSTSPQTAPRGVASFCGQSPLLPACGRNWLPVGGGAGRDGEAK